MTEGYDPYNKTLPREDTPEEGAVDFDPEKDYVSDAVAASEENAPKGESGSDGPWIDGNHRHAERGLKRDSRAMGTH